MDLRTAIETGDVTMVTYLLETQPLPPAGESHALLKLSLSPDSFKYFGFYVYKLLLEHGAPISDDYEVPGQDTLLHLAVERGDPYDVVAEDDDGEKLVQIVEEMLGQNLSVTAVNARNETPIHLAAKNNVRDILELLVEKLMEQPAKLANIVDQDGVSLFHIVCSCEDPEHASVFLDRVPTIDVYQAIPAESSWRPGYTALDLASVYGRDETVELLQQHVE